MSHFEKRQRNIFIQIKSSKQNMDTNDSTADLKPVKANKHDRDGPKRFKNERHRMQKREPRKPFQRDNDIYITNKTDFNVSMKDFNESESQYNDT